MKAVKEDNIHKQEGGLEEGDRRGDPLPSETGGPVGPQREGRQSCHLGKACLLLHPTKHVFLI